MRPCGTLERMRRSITGLPELILSIDPPNSAKGYS